MKYIDWLKIWLPLPKLKSIKKNNNSEFLVSSNGNAVFVRSYQRSFELLLKKLNIVHHGFHSLRHTFATRALECGMDIKTLFEILGHKNPTVTLNRYAHSLLEHKQDMMDCLGKLLQNVHQIIYLMHILVGEKEILGLYEKLSTT